MSVSVTQSVHIFVYKWTYLGRMVSLGSSVGRALDLQLQAGFDPCFLVNDFIVPVT